MNLSWVRETIPSALRSRKAAAVAANLAVWLMVAIDAYFLWPVQLGGQTSMIIVQGDSMVPAFNAGDLLVARVMTPAEGDVIIYRPENSNGAQVVHRIVGGDGEDGWVVKGDANAFIDPYAPTAADVTGVVLLRYPSFGKVSALMLSPLTWALVILAAVAVLFGSRERRKVPASGEGVSPPDGEGPLVPQEGVDAGERAGSKEPA